MLVRATVLMLLGAAATGINFVDVLKHDLRRNNDDYIDSTAKNITSSVATTKAANSAGSKANGPGDVTTRAPFKQLFRRKDSVKDSLPTPEIGQPLQLEDDTIPVRSDIVPFLPSDQKNLNDIVVEQRAKLSTPASKAASFSVTMNNKQLLEKSVKLDKLKKFMHLHKNKLNEFVKKKRQQDQIKPIARTVDVADVAPTTKGSSDEITLKQTSNIFTNINDLMQLIPRTTRNADYLDMAPAKAAEIQAMRMRNRLCNRNVMLPEGPKYDSHGNMYLGAYTHIYGRDYSKTRVPTLLLPRCCNCCKKSVLGCE